MFINTDIKTAQVADDDRLYSIEEAATVLHVGVRMIRRLTSERRIAFIKVGRHVRIQGSALNRFVQLGLVIPVREKESMASRDRGYGIKPKVEVMSS
jgi:excisionase family DNA binding protein